MNGSEPSLVAHYKDRLSGADAWFVVDTFLHGVAGGGIRMDRDVDEQMMRHLAATMSIKLSVVHPPLGGAKCGIRYDPRSPDSHDVLCRVIRTFAPFLRTCWVTGSDLGTDWSEVVAACRTHAGIPHPQYALMNAYGSRDNGDVRAGVERLARGTSLIVDDTIGLTMSNAVTGWTVCAAAEEALRVKGERIDGKTVSIQGFGAVGGSAAKFLAERGATIAAVSDERGAIIGVDGNGLDVGQLLELREPPSRKLIDRERLRSLRGYEFIERDAVLYQPVDILIPAAGSNIPIAIDRVQARYVVEAANDPFAENVEEALCRKGLTVVPDAIANAGNAGLYGLLVAGDVAITREAIFASLSDQVQKMTKAVLERSTVFPRKALNAIAREHIHNTINAGHSILPNGLDTKDIASLQSEDLNITYRASSRYADERTRQADIESRAVK
ncbi:MAG TPA: Glu/Leu/Phe/Val dehydrogenase dimerization domain-containing protein [Bacteroidota bacterium]